MGKVDALEFHRGDQVMKSVIDVYGDIVKSNPVWTAEEEATFIKKWCKKRTMDTFVNEAMKHNIGLVFNVMGKVAFNKCDEDIFQKAVVAMVEALRTYDPKKGVRLSTYLVNPIRWAILRSQDTSSDCGSVTDRMMAMARRTGRKVTTISIEERIGNDEESETIGSRITTSKLSPDYVNARGLKSSNEDVRENAIVDGVRMALKKIPFTDREKVVLVGLLSGKNMSQIATELNLTRMRISQVTAGAFVKIRKSKYATSLKGLI